MRSNRLVQICMDVVQLPNHHPKPNTTQHHPKDRPQHGTDRVEGMPPPGEFLLSSEEGEGEGSRQCAGPHLCGTRAGAMERETGTPRGATGAKDQDGRRGQPWRTRVDGEDKVILHARPSAVPQTKPSVSCKNSGPPPHSTRLVKLRCFSWKSLRLHVGRGALLEPSLHVMSEVEGKGRYRANSEVGTRPPKEDLFILGFGCALNPNKERADRPLKEAHTGLWRRRRRNKQWTGQVIPQLHLREERASTALANQERWLTKHTDCASETARTHIHAISRGRWTSGRLCMSEASMTGQIIEQLSSKSQTFPRCRVPFAKKQRAMLLTQHGLQDLYLFPMCQRLEQGG